MGLRSCVQSVCTQLIDVSMVFQIISELEEIGSRMALSADFIESQLRSCAVHNVVSPVKKRVTIANLRSLWLDELTF